MPQNVSREQLQQNKTMIVVSKKLVKKVLELFKKLSMEGDSGVDDDEKKEDGEEEEKEAKDEEKKDKRTRSPRTRCSTMSSG